MQDDEGPVLQFNFASNSKGGERKSLLLVSRSHLNNHLASKISEDAPCAGGGDRCAPAVRAAAVASIPFVYADNTCHDGHRATTADDAPSLAGILSIRRTMWAHALESSDR